MALTINTRTYNLDRSNPDAVSYTGPAHTFTITDKADLKRVAPKPTKDFAGVARPTFKLTKSVVVDSVSGARADAIVTLSASLPVGMADADVTALLADIAAFAAGTDASNLFKKLDVNA